MASATPVTNHDEIREWVESHGGRPARVKGTAALLRVDFGEPDPKLQPITWDQWFDTFESRRLAAMIQEGGRSRFIKLVSRGSANARRTRAGRAPSRKTAGRGASTGARKAAASTRGERRSPTSSPRTARSASTGAASTKSIAKRSAAARKGSTRSAAARSASAGTRSSAAARSSAGGTRGSAASRGKKAGGARKSGRSSSTKKR